MRPDTIAMLAAIVLLASPPIIPAQDAQEPAPPLAVQYEDTQAVLAALEDADEDLNTFASGIIYTIIKDLGGAITQRTGEIAFASNRTPDGTASRRFAVRFETLRAGDRFFDDERAQQTIAFDGRWLYEMLPSEGQINKREIVRAGENVDPFELGDGPFPPLPIGQKKDDILRRYDVRLVPQTQSLQPDPELDPDDPYDHIEVNMARGLMAFASGSVQLLLVPKQRAGDARFSEIRLWYKPDSDGRLLPRMSRTVDATSKDVSIVQLMHPLEVNGPPREDLLTITPQAGWTVNETRLAPPPLGRTTGTDPRDDP